MTSDVKPEVAAAIATYFQTRTQGPWAISTAQAMKRIREQLPEGTISDKELIRLIAKHAISRGHNVSFDESEISQK